MNDQLFETGNESGAEFSPCRTYRYALWRRWDWSIDDLVMFIGLNPSTADETEDDPTIRRCIRFAKGWGYCGLIMMNAYAFRATDPNVMQAAADPVGPDNFHQIIKRSCRAEVVIAAWGTHCPTEHQEKILKAIGKPVHCLGRNKNGTPKHPLYLRADTKPELFWKPTCD